MREQGGFYDTTYKTEESCQCLRARFSALVDLSEMATLKETVTMSNGQGVFRAAYDGGRESS